MKFLIFLTLMTICAAFCSCSKTQLQPEPTCRKVLILSYKYNRDKTPYIKPIDTPYQDVLCGHWLEVFRENKKIWDLDTGFVVCDRDLFERRIYVIK